jgi:hypothetical protein
MVGEGLEIPFLDRWGETGGELPERASGDVSDWAHADVGRSGPVMSPRIVIERLVVSPADRYW